MDQRRETLPSRTRTATAHDRPGEAASERRRLRLPPLVAALRPKQWVKNGLLLLAFIFSLNESWRPLEPDSWAPLLADALLGFLAFTTVASALYLLNDLVDLESD